MTVHGLSQEPLAKLHKLAYTGRLKIKSTQYGGSIGDILDNKDAAEYLQEQLDILDELAGIFPTRQT